ncbi:putative phosphothreonine lyase domain-containing protein [Streptomyces sp. NPDC056656]|uniref:putative phosphothreonine lyase domain-containing protein n=1 Tax=Streptomyces sp. NPDC056656 TaxID=3345895 RepID=UPI00368820CE
MKVATETGSLGPQSTAATLSDARGDATRRPICICTCTCTCTDDWRDEDDVHRVPLTLRGLGIVDRLICNTDAATPNGQYGNGVGSSPPASPEMHRNHREPQALRPWPSDAP